MVKNTKANIAKLYKAKSKHLYELYEMYKRDGNETEAGVAISESIVCDTVVWCLTDPDFFARSYAIFFKKETECE